MNQDAEGASIDDSAHGRPGAGASPAPRASLATLTLGALGIVFGDIGTSPLYALRECLRETGPTVQPADVYGLLSLLFWALTLVVTLKYLTFIMRADNQGEGGIFALLALLPERLRSTSEPVLARGRALDGAADRVGVRRISPVALLVVVGASLLYGDGAITPAISVLSAIEGLTVVRPALEQLVVPLTCAILVVLFAVQRRGTGTVGALFGPIMALWFLVIGGLGLYHVATHPGVLVALSPHHALVYLLTHGGQGLFVLGSVVLAVTGGEALYADMGHFGARPIRYAWLGFVMPALVLCYFGQGALVLASPPAAENPFYSMVPAGPATVLLVALSSAATIIASQALISGTFSLTRQAMQLGYFPRVSIRHTAAHTEGQIYIPQVNWLLAVGCLLLVVGFGQSERLAAAYGFAVTGTMTLTSVVYFFVARHTWGWSRALAGGLVAAFLAVDLPFFAANVVKVPHGGWVPLVIGAAFVATMLVWNQGRSLIVAQYMARFGTVEDALPRIRGLSTTRSPGLSVFMASSTAHVPPVLVHLVERLRTLPELVFLLTVVPEPCPYVADPDRRLEVVAMGDGWYRIVARRGFMEAPDVPAMVQDALARLDLSVLPDAITYFLGRERVLGHRAGAMGVLAENLFGYLQRNAIAADLHFKIPPQQVIELGIQLDL